METETQEEVSVTSALTGVHMHGRKLHVMLNADGRNYVFVRRSAPKELLHTVFNEPRGGFYMWDSNAHVITATGVPTKDTVWSREYRLTSIIVDGRLWTG